jgi:hypothetical protein
MPDNPSRPKRPLRYRIRDALGLGPSPWLRLAAFDREHGGDFGAPSVPRRLAALLRERRGLPPQTQDDWTLARARALWAIDRQDLAALQALRDRLGPEFSERCVHGQSPFFMAALRGHAPSMRLLARDVSPWASDWDKGTPALGHAVWRMDVETVQELASRSPGLILGQNSMQIFRDFASGVSMPPSFSDHPSDERVKAVFEALLACAGREPLKTRETLFDEAIEQIAGLGVAAWPVAAELGRRLAAVAPLPCCVRFVDRVEREARGSDAPLREAMIARVEAAELAAAIALGANASASQERRGVEAPGRAGLSEPTASEAPAHRRAARL